MSQPGRPDRASSSPLPSHPSETINALLAASAAAFADRPALAHKQGENYQSITYRELLLRVRRFASGLLTLGVKAGDGVGMVSENRPEWAVADLALLALGAINVPMFPTLPPAQIEAIIADSGARLLIVSSEAQLAKALEVRARIPGLRLITMDGATDPEHGITAFAEVLARGEEAPLTPEAFAARAAAVQPDDLASIVYTSGTTGEPKGVMLTHRNFVSNVEGSLNFLRFGPDDVFVSFLPLNHCLERMAGYYAPLRCGSLIAYAQSLRRLRDNIREMRPTYLILVPRVYEAIHQAVLERIHAASPARQRLFAWALEVGRARMIRRQAGQALSPLLAAQWWLADRLVWSKVRHAVGLDRVKRLISGGAPLAEETAIFFHAAGMPLLEGYGMTETAPVLTFNAPDDWKLNTVGRAVPGVELRLAAEGEIVCRGPNVMIGYHNKPAATAAMIDAEGWLHTGDLGELDEDGFLRITGRIKDLIVLSNGKKIAPQFVEGELLKSPLVLQVVAVGDGSALLGALIVPNVTRLRHAAAAQGLQLPRDPAAAAQSPAALKLIRQEVQRVSDRLADFETPHGVALLDHELTVENGMLTPTLKLKRNVVAERYADLIASICPRG